MAENSYISNYYENYYPANCKPDDRYISTKNGFSVICQIIGLISLPIQVLTMYCICTKTPSIMKPVKGSLINLNFWYMFSQIIFSFCITAYCFFPCMAEFSAGITAKLNIPSVVQLYVTALINCVLVTSITILFENRSSSIYRNKFRISKTRNRIIWIGINVVGPMSMLTVLFFNLPEQTQAKIDLLKVLPCPTKEFFLEPLVILSSTGFWKTYTNQCFKLIFLIPMLQIIFFSFCCIYYLVICKNSNVSVQTRRLQIRSFFGILVQTVIPSLLVFVPMILCFEYFRVDEYDQTRNNLVIISYIAHNGFASLSIILVHGPYRQFLKSKFICKKQSVRHISNNMT